MREIIVKVHEIAVDGFPSVDRQPGCTAFIFDGCVVSGWPLHSDPGNYDILYSGCWEADPDVGRHIRFANVTHWIEFPEPLVDLEKPQISRESGATPAKGRLPAGGKTQYTYLAMGATGQILLATTDASRAHELAQNVGGMVVRVPVVGDYRDGDES